MISENNKLCCEFHFEYVLPKIIGLFRAEYFDISMKRTVEDNNLKCVNLYIYKMQSM